MGEWKAMDTAPTDGTWIKVRGWDFGIEGSRRHYATAFYENGNWFEVGSNGSQLRYLTEWQELSGTSSGGDDEVISMQGWWLGSMRAILTGRGRRVARDC